MKTLEEQVKEELAALEEKPDNVIETTEPDDHPIEEMDNDNDAEDVVETPEPVKEDTSSRAMAQMGWELREANRKIRELAEKAEQAQKPQPVVEEDPRPDPDADPLGFSRWETRQVAKQVEALSKTVGGINETFQQQTKRSQEANTYSQAKNELMQIEEGFSKTVPDYKDVAGQTANRIYRELQFKHPNASQQQLQQAAEQRILHEAAEFYQMGLNPAEAFYKREKTIYGFQPKTIEDSKTDLATIEKNRKKSANGLNTGKSSKNNLTLESVAQMSAAELDKIPKEELQALYYS